MIDTFQHEYFGARWNSVLNFFGLTSSEAHAIYRIVADPDSEEQEQLEFEFVEDLDSAEEREHNEEGQTS